MDRIKGAGHVNNRFVAEDIATSRPPTEITPEWMNSVQEEICSVIAGAGIELDGGSHEQLLQALQALFTGNPAHEALVQAFTGHVEGADPHDQYMTQPETDGLIRSFFVSEEAAAQGAGDWNAVENTRPGVGPKLLTGNAANGPDASAAYYHALSFGYAAADGSGNVTQLAIPYGSPCENIYFRGRFEGTWTLWRRVWSSASLDETRFAQPGDVKFTAGWTATPGWLKANGALISRSAYPALFNAIGTTYGAGDGATTFALPDLRGEFIRGFDDGRGIDAARAMGSWQGDSFQGHKHAITGYVGNTTGGANGFMQAGTSVYDPWPTQQLVTDGVNGAPRVGNETRPRNIALLGLIKY